MVLGAGLAGCCTALSLAARGFEVDLYDRHKLPMNGASLHNEGKLHLGYVYAADPESRSHEVMIRGSSSFRPILQKLTGVPISAFKLSIPFIYAIPEDSQISPEKLTRHFKEVDASIDAYYDDRHDALDPVKPLAHSRMSRDELTKYFNARSICAGFQTHEISVEPQNQCD